MADGGQKPMDIDSLIDLDPAASLPPAPASRRFQPKIKGKVKAEPASDPIKKQEEDHPAATPSSSAAAIAKEKENEEEEEGLPSASASRVASTSCNGMEVDDVREEEDTVVQELDVFFNPGCIDEDTLLYVMQYPLRPTWRPYELDERCLEVKLKPKEMKVEVDLSIDTDNENYDQERPESLKLQKQTLSSTKVPLVTTYAIGVLMGRKVHLNSVHAVVQLRPSMEYYHAGRQKHASRIVEASSMDNGETSKANQVAVVSNKNIKDAEPWISLEYKAKDSDSANEYLEKMVVQAEDQIQFTMKLSDYLDLLCQGTLTHKKRTKIPSTRVLLSMPLHERLRIWLSEVTVNRFNALVHIAPEVSEEDLLKILVLHADLVQGIWVTKSSLLYVEEREERVRRLRDYFLCLFSKNPLVRLDNKKVNVPAEVVRRLMSPLAYERSVIGGWNFKEATDFTFIKKHSDIVKEHECAWLTREKNFLDSISGSRGNLGQKISRNINSATRMVPGKMDTDPHKSKGGSVSLASTTMPDETQEHLQKALLKLFKDHSVRSFNSIIHGLWDMAMKISSNPKYDESRNKKIVDAVKNGASAPPAELDPVICKVAVKIHGVYVSSTLGNPAIDPLRNVVIELFRGKGANGKLTKQEICAAAKISLNRDITDAEYKQVMRELCESDRGSWLLKNGDNKP